VLTKYDPWVNMLRGTVAAFAAGVGGATSVTVLPFDTALGIPDALGRRVARNTSSLLIHESHVARVTDPAGGSYAVEKLTDDLARRGWEELQKLEADGGVDAALDRPGGFHDRIRDEAMQPRRQQVATRRRAITGVSEFPNLHESLPERRPWPESSRENGADRYGLAFEALRDDPATTPVLLATLGPVAQHTARATFAANLLAAGGVDTTSAGPTTSAEDVVTAFRNADPQTGVVCVAGTDAAYAEWGAEVVAELREAGASYVVLAGKPGEKTLDESLVDDHCAVGIDALAFLDRVRAALEATS
jgi:methylmalonyl-CoA mutase